MNDQRQKEDCQSDIKQKDRRVSARLASKQSSKNNFSLIHQGKQEQKSPSFGSQAQIQNHQSFLQLPAVATINSFQQVQPPQKKQNLSLQKQESTTIQRQFSNAQPQLSAYRFHNQKHDDESFENSQSFADNRNENIFENEIEQIKMVSDNLVNQHRGIVKKKEQKQELKNISDVFQKDTSVRLTRQTSKIADDQNLRINQTLQTNFFSNFDRKNIVQNKNNQIRKIVKFNDQNIKNQENKNLFLNPFEKKQNSVKQEVQNLNIRQQQSKSVQKKEVQNSKESAQNLHFQLSAIRPMDSVYANKQKPNLQIQKRESSCAPLNKQQYQKQSLTTSKKRQLPHQELQNQKQFSFRSIANDQAYNPQESNTNQFYPFNLNISLGEMQNSIIGHVNSSEGLNEQNNIFNSNKIKLNQHSLQLKNQTTQDFLDMAQIEKMNDRSNQVYFRNKKFPKIEDSINIKNITDKLGRSKENNEIYDKRYRKDDFGKQINQKNMIQVNLLPNKRQSGIKDDESILCPTPPEHSDENYPFGRKMIQFVTPINFTVNLNNQNYRHQKPGGSSIVIDQDVENHNSHMIQLFQQQSHSKPSQLNLKQRRSQNGLLSFAEGPYLLDTVETGDFKNEDTNSLNDRNQNFKRKREQKYYKKQQPESGTSKKQVTFKLNRQNTKDSILKISSQGQSLVQNNENNYQNDSSSSKRKTRGLGKKTIKRHSLMASDPQLTLLKKKSSITKQILTCKCSRSGCLKMYCECFTMGRFCDETCACKNCQNNDQNQNKIRQARKNIRNRNPLAFKPKVENQGPYKLFEQSSIKELDQYQNPEKANLKVKIQQGSQTKCTKQSFIDSSHISGCKCRKSQCQKKYCECFQMGVLCTNKCICTECKNTISEVKRRMENDDFLNEFADFID